MATHVELRRCIKVLSEYVSVSRRQRLEEIARSKCHNIAVLLENVVDTGNENAVARTMDGLGFHRMYRLRTNPILLNPSSKLNKLQRTDAGARKWLGVHTINKFDDCIEAIKRDGYRLACALPDAKDSIYSIDLKQKTVFAFGNETSGVSESLKKASDIRFSLPMHGFVESYNVSVAAAITLFHAYTEIRKAKAECDDHMGDQLLFYYYVQHLGKVQAEAILQNSIDVTGSSFVCKLSNLYNPLC